MRRYHVLVAVILALIGAYVAFWFYALDKAKTAFDTAVAAERGLGRRHLRARVPGQKVPRPMEDILHRHAAMHTALRSECVTPGDRERCSRSRAGQHR